MIRITLTAALVLSLGACVSLPRVSLPKTDKAAPAASIGASCPGGLRAEIQPQPALPDAAGFPAPVTPEEKAQTAAYLEWLSGFAAWGRAGWSRASDAKAFCEAK